MLSNSALWLQDHVAFYVTCIGTDTSLWQWVTESNDGKSQVQTIQMMCRDGADAYTAPKCPYEACIGLHCTECSDDWSA